ncbi:MAG: 50S ribosomal protein L3 [archaeon]
MPKRVMPRHGSMQFWPRKRARRAYPRIRSTSKYAEPKLIGFAGYKAGMSHIMAIDNRKHTITKGEEIFMPVTIIECPPLRLAGMRCYWPNKKGYGTSAAKDIFFKADKSLARKITPSKKPKTQDDLSKINPDDYIDIAAIVYTQPRLTGIGKKKPELFEMKIGGKSNAERLNFIKEHIDKEITIAETFNEGALIDTHAITTGKGFQGPAKRFGIQLKKRKTEKGIRGVGSLGPWKAQGHIMYRVPHAGQMGYHQRIQYNNQIIKIGTKPDEVNPKGGFIRFGKVKTTYTLIFGSIPGPKKRLIIFTHAIRPSRAEIAPTVQYVSLESQQGN